MKRIQFKTPKEMEIMGEGGRLLGEIRDELSQFVKPGIKAIDIENLAVKLIDKTGGQASFKLVPGYSWATCININEEVVHTIPGQRLIKEGDIVGIDVGLFYKGWHTDTAVTVPAGHVSEKTKKFLEVGKKSDWDGIKQVKQGNRIADISKAIQDVVEGAGFTIVKSLTGHGVGKDLHEEPSIPCFVLGDRMDSPKLEVGTVLAIEVMYNEGSGEVAYKDTDGWTIVTVDGKISGLFEETVAITPDGPKVLTHPQK
jgi:methionyl aminopeptidase